MVIFDQDKSFSIGQPVFKAKHMSDENSDAKCVSVIIPTHNCALYLTDCLQSVFNQSWKHLQIIVIDDGSTDDTPRLLNQLQMQDSRLDAYRSTQALGASRARNIGLEKATGDYIFFLDADDWLEAAAIEKLLIVMQKQSTNLAIAGYAQNKQHQRLTIHFDFPSVTNLHDEQLYFYIQQYLARPYKKVMLVHCWGRLYQRALIEKHHIRFNEKLTQFEDVHFNFQYLENIQALTYLPESLYHHRVHQQQSLSQRMGMEGDFVGKTCAAFSQVSTFLQNRYAVSPLSAEKMVAATTVSMCLVSILRLCRRFKNAPSILIYQQIVQIVKSSIFQEYLSHIRPQKGESYLLYWASRSGFVPLVLLAGLSRVIFLQLGFYWRAYERHH